MKEKRAMFYQFNWLDTLEELDDEEFKAAFYATVEYYRTGKTTVKLSPRSELLCKSIFMEMDNQRKNKK